MRLAHCKSCPTMPLAVPLLPGQEAMQFLAGAFVDVSVSLLSHRCAVEHPSGHMPGCNCTLSLFASSMLVCAATPMWLAKLREVCHSHSWKIDFPSC